MVKGTQSSAKQTASAAVQFSSPPPQAHGKPLKVLESHRLFHSRWTGSPFPPKHWDSFFQYIFSWCWLNYSDQEWWKWMTTAPESWWQRGGRSSRQGLCNQCLFELVWGLAGSGEVLAAGQCCDWGYLLFPCLCSWSQSLCMQLAPLCAGTTGHPQPKLRPGRRLSTQVTSPYKLDLFFKPENRQLPFFPSEHEERCKEPHGAASLQSHAGRTLLWFCYQKSSC